MIKKIENIKNLVICSTLNQITNYLIIKKFKPKQIFNITFKKEVKKQFNINIKPHDWDRYLKETIKDINIINIELSENDFDNVEKIKEIINNEILKEVNKEIYWHITGGQRTLALAISNILNNSERKEDKILYVEGNTEQLIVHNYDMSIDTKLDNEYNNNYSLNDLTLEDAFKLVGFKTKKLESTCILKKNGKSEIDENNNKYKFYRELYIKLTNEKEFRDILLKSNEIKGNIKKDENDNKIEDNERQKFIKKYFNQQEFQNKDYYKDELDEFNKSFPAGYIFENITTYKIYDLIKNNDKVIDMRASIKTYFDEDSFDKESKEDESKKNLGIIDELDIVLLTNTGKIINFECKSGGMSGDNAKSHNYTTYRLNGVFGMPILLSPLYTNEAYIEKVNNESENFLKTCREAYKSAQRAELERICIDEIEVKLKELLK